MGSQEVSDWKGEKYSDAVKGRYPAAGVMSQPTPLTRCMAQTPHTAHLSSPSDCPTAGILQCYSGMFEHRSNANKYFPGLLLHKAFIMSKRPCTDLVQFLEGETCIRCIQPQSDSSDSPFQGASARGVGCCCPTRGQPGGSIINGRTLACEGWRKKRHCIFNSCQRWETHRSVFGGEEG